MIITLCGSARFEKWFHAWNRALSLAGHGVFGMSSYPSQNRGNKDWYTPEQKELLDKVHLKKIDASDAIVVLNVFAYLGDSTLREIEYAFNNKKEVYFLESWGEGLGIGIHHYQSVQDAAESYGIPKGYGSPISTVTNEYPLYRNRCIWNLLGEAGKNRSSIVDFLNKELQYEM